jgi:integrase
MNANDSIVLRSDADVRRLKRPGKGQFDHKTEFPGLQLRHFASGLKVWFIQARRAGAGPVWVKLGEYPAMKLAQAQLACSEARDSLRRGVDPRDEQAAATAAHKAARMRFGDAAEAWIAEQCARKINPWRATTAEKVRFVLLGGRLKPWRDRLLSSFDVEDVQGVIDELEANTKHTFLAPIRGLCKWAVRRGYIAKSPVEGVTAPHAEGDAAPLVVFEEEGEPDFAELKAIIECLGVLQESLPLSPWPTIYRLGLLTGARYSEVLALPRAEVDLDRAIWTLPAARSKMKAECQRPLSAAAVAVLRGVAGAGELYFPGKIKGRPLTKTGREPAILSAMLAAKGFKRGFWYGRLRDTVASWLEFQTDATERAMAVILNHRPPRDNTRRRHYTEISGRKQARVLLERWAAQLQRIEEGTGHNVVAFKAAK